MFFYQSCNTHDNILSFKHINEVDAKIWLHTNGMAYKNETLSVQTKNGQVLKGKLNWQLAKHYIWNNRNYLDVPYEFGDKLIPLIENNSVQFNLVFRRTTIGIEAAIRTTTLDHKAVNIITGKVGTIQLQSYQLLNGRSINAWQRDSYNSLMKSVNMIVTGDIQTKDLQSLIGSNISQNQTNVRKVQNCYYYSTTTYTNYCYAANPSDDPHDVNSGQICGTTTQTVITMICENAPIEIDSYYPPVEGGGGSGSEGNENNTNDTISNQITDTCLYNMVNDVLNSGLKNEITTFLNNNFASSYKYNLFFYQFSNPNGQKDAETVEPFYPDVNNYGIMKTTIRLNISALDSASREYIAATIFHEAAHAWIDYLYKTNSQEAEEHHNKLATQWFDKMKDALIEMFPNLTKQYAEDLTWGGLQNTIRFQSLDLITQNRILHTNNEFKKSKRTKKGTSCP